MFKLKQQIHNQGHIEKILVSPFYPNLNFSSRYLEVKEVRDESE